MVWPNSPKSARFVCKHLFSQAGIRNEKIKRAQAETGKMLHAHLPITPLILHQLFKVWSEFHGRCKATYCLGFFGFLRAAEFTEPSWEKIKPGAHLTISNVAVDSHNDPSI